MGQPTISAREVGLSDPGRVQAFSDGVFAIIITLLVLAHRRQRR